MSGTRRAGAARRWWLWMPLLAVAAWLAIFGDKTPATSAAVSLPTRPLPATVVPAPAAPRAKAGADNNESLAVLVPRTDLIPEPERPAAGGRTPASPDPFSTRNWNPPSPPPATPSTPAAPVAPPLPYAFIGKKQEAETWEVYLMRGEQTFVAREGEVLEGSYRIDKIEPPTLTLTYLPLGQIQTLTIGDTR